MSLIFYNNPICPFGQRAWITLLEKDIKFETQLVPLTGEIQDGKSRGLTENINWRKSGLSIEQLQQCKDYYVQNINPTGEVPVIKQDEQFVRESEIVSETLQKLNEKSGNNLWSSDPFEEARFRTTMKHYGEGIRTQYQLLMNQDPAKDQDFVTKINKTYQNFVNQLDKEGPFYNGAQFTLVDSHVFPFVHRFVILLKLFRGIDLLDNANGYGDKLRKWYEAVLKRDSVQKSLLTDELYVQFYKFYASGMKIQNGEYVGRLKP